MRSKKKLILFFTLIIPNCQNEQTTKTIEEYVNNLAETLTKITMNDFFKEVHSKYYNDQDISFMEYFLDLINHNKEFYVHHSKLVEYGVMTSQLNQRHM
jgi:hypothetical protein